jgi:hypothetical protein
MQLIRCLLSNFLSQHVSVIIMSIIRRIRPCPTACGVLPGCVHTQPTHPGRTPHAVGHGLILLMMDIMMAETCWDRKFDNKHRISRILLVPSLHLTFTMPGHKKPKTDKDNLIYKGVPTQGMISGGPIKIRADFSLVCYNTNAVR